MAWDGWFSYDGTEIINVARTEAYVQHAGPAPWFDPAYENDSLGPGLGDGRTYASPLVDSPAWVDPDDPNSYGFWGVYPLGVSGVEDSTRGSSVVESTGNGGVPGRLRHGTKQVVFNTVLMGESEAAVEYGFRWLSTALLGGPCGASGPVAASCSGADLCFLSSEPSVEWASPVDESVVTPDPIKPPVTTTLETYDGGTATTTGTLYDGGTAAATGDLVIEGDTFGIYESLVDGGRPTAAGTTVYDGGSAAAAGDIEMDGGPVGVLPVVDEPEVELDELATAMACLAPLVRSLRRVVFNSGPTVTSKRTISDGSVAWTVSFTAVAGVPFQYGPEVPVIDGFLDPAVDVPWYGGVVPDGGDIDLDGFVHTDARCVVGVYQPLYDPLCPPLVPPPEPPSITMGCYSPPANWRRRQITIPAQYVPAWGEVVPQFKVHARTRDLRNLRLRFYADPQGNGDISENPCSFCGDLVVSYVPEGSTLVFDGVTESIWVEGPAGHRRRGDSLVFSTEGTPFDWPSLTCGLGYIVTLDLPQYEPPPVFDLSLFARAS